MRALQLAAAALDNMVDELLVDFSLKGFQPRHIFFRLGPERVEDHLALAGGIDAPVDTKLLDRPVKTEAGRHHADGSDDRGGVGVDFIGRCRQPIPTACRHILAEGKHRHIGLAGQITNPLANQRRLHR